MKNVFREIHRRSLWQVLGIYLAGGWVALQVVETLTESMGLPDWVQPFAVVLLVVGLPVVLATAFVQKGGPVRRGGAALRPFASPSDTPFGDASSPPASGAEPGTRAVSETVGAAATTEATAPAGLPRAGAEDRLLTWRNATIGGVLAFALLGLMTAGWMAMRTFGIGPAATLVSAGVLEERDRVILAEFDSASGDSVLAETATEALRVDLAQSPIVRVAEPRFVSASLARMERPADTHLDRDLAVELAVREGVKAVIAGELNAAGGGYVLTAEVIETATDETLVSERVTARSEEELLDAIDQLSRGLREEIGESLRTIRADPPLERATTGSLEALRLFSQGTYAIDAEGNNLRGITLLQQAVTIDSAFALAWRKLGTQQRNMGFPTSVWAPALRRAYEQRDRLSERERLLTVASYNGYLTLDHARAVAAYESMIELDPEDGYALNNAALSLGFLEEFERAEIYALRAVEAPPQQRFPYQVALWVQVAQGKWDEAHATLDAMGKALPGIPELGINRGHLAYGEGDYALAAEMYTADLDRRRSNPGVRAGRSNDLAKVARARGQLGEAERRLADIEASLSALGFPTAGLRAAIGQAIMAIWLRDDPAPALTSVDEALAVQPLDAIPVEDRPYPVLVNVYALGGRPDRVRQLLDEYRRVMPPELLREDAVLQGTGLIALAEGRDDEAIAHLLQAQDGRCTRHCAFLARAYDAIGQRDSALAVMERYLTAPIWDPFGWSPDSLGPFMERVGQLYDERGDVENAAKYYAMFVELWADADEELQPRVAAAQARLQEILEARG